MTDSAFVTGITGQDGTILAARLAAEGLEVHGLVQTAAEAAEREGTFDPHVELHIGELTDEALLIGLIGELAPAEVYNLGGISSVALSWRHPALTGAVSGLGAVHVMEGALAAQERSGRAVRLVQASSAEIFGEPDRTPQDESTRIRPVSPYGAAKAYAHHMAGVFRTRGLHVATCILYNHESTLRPPTFVTRKVSMAAARIARDGGGTVTLGDLTSRRDWGWAPDYVDAMVRAVRHDVADDFVIATGRTHSVEQLVATAMARVGIDDWRRHVTVDQSFVRPADTLEQIGDATRARRELGWEPVLTFEEIIGRMVDHDIALLEAS